MPHGFTFAADDKAGGAAPSGKSAFSWDADDPTHSQALARVAQPTQFEKNAAAAGASATPWTDTARGFGQGLMGTAALVGRGIHAIPGVGPALIPAQGLAAEQKMSIPHTPGEKLGSNIEGVAEAALPVGEVLDAAKGSKYIRPAAQFISENVIPEIKSLPYVGRGIEAAEKAPTLVKAAIRGGTTGATLGGLEQAIRTRNLEETAKGALYGGAGGAILGMGAHGINRLAGAGTAGEIPTVSKAPFELTPPPQPTEQAIQQKMEFPQEIPATQAPAPIAQIPAAGRVGPPMQRLGELIEKGAGTRPLEPAVPLRNQLPQSIGSASEGFIPATDPMKNAGGPITFRREPIVKTVPGLEEGPLRAQAPEGIPTAATEEPARQMGAPPLQGNIPLREQFKPTGAEPPSKQLTLEQKYPDRELRQLVHANGEGIVQATGNDRDTLKAIHDLKNTDVRQALINSGEDVGQMSIGNRKATGNQITRQEAFDRLLAKGHSPQQIVDLAKQAAKEGYAGAGKPDLMRATEGRAREKTGD